jgi:hypothetical protein
MPGIGNDDGGKLDRARQHCGAGQGDASGTGRVLREMMRGLAGIVVVDRAVVVVVMVARADQVIDFMSDIESHRGRVTAHLQGKALQRKEQHQQNAKKSTHVKIAPQEPIGYTRPNFLASSRVQIKNFGKFFYPIRSRTVYAFRCCRAEKLFRRLIPL